jgi:hypothetical protein
MSVWTIRDASGVEKAVADWGLCALTRERINQMPDVVTFRAESALSDADPIFAYGSVIQLFRDEVPWFYGRVVQVPGRATSKVEEQLYRVAGPWWYLENLVFQQVWELTDGTDSTLVATNKSRLVLSQAADGSKYTTGAAIAEVLAYATARGAPITAGTITPAATVPYAEALDRSCAEVIRNLLRWTPDAMAAFDYTTAPFPTLSIHLRADAPVISLPAYGAPVTGLELSARHDLLVPAVVLKFEQTNDIDNDTFVSLITDAAPSTATGDELGALVMTFDLSGARATYHHQPVVTAEIPTSDTTPNVVDWWKGKFAWLNDFDDSDLSVLAGTQLVAIENPTAYADTSVSEVPNELVEGSVSAWMGVESAPLLVSATLVYSGAATEESSEVFGGNNQRVVYTRVLGTSAETGTYSRLTSETDAEPVPVGLAAAIFAATGVLQYDGAIELTEQECSGAGAPGALLNLTGGRAEWAAMAAQIQRVEENIDLGQTKIVVGPAKHLGQTEITAWLRANRERRLSYRLSERTTGRGDGNAAKVMGGEQMPRSDSIFRPSAGTSEPDRPFEILDLSDATGLKVQVNANSFLQQSLTPNDTFAITGLATPMTAVVGTQIWLEIDFDPDSAEVTAATIGSGPSGWSGFPAPFVYTGTYPDQVLTTTFLLIGYIAAADSPLDGTVIKGGPADAPVSGKIIQCVAADVLLQNVVFNGLPAVFPFPHHAPSI